MLLMIGTNDTKKPTPLDVYSDNIRQIVLSSKANGLTPIVATLPELTFSTYYQRNRDFIKEYSLEILRLSNMLDFVTCDMSNMEKFLIDGVHFDNEGYREIAHRFSKVILGMK